jgi:two-component sensor histidine kinase
VADNGQGLPPDFRIEQPDTVGIRLVDFPVKQLDGEMELEGREGASFRIRFQAGK